MLRSPIILIHGFRGAREGLVEVAQYLVDYDCYVPDIPPASGQKMKQYSLDSYAEFLKKYINDNNLQNPILIGHSMGSIVAAYTANKYKDLVNDKLILISPIIKKPPLLVRLSQVFIFVFPASLISFFVTKFLTTEKDRIKLNKALLLTNKCVDKYKSKLELFKSAIFATNNSINDFKIDKDVLFILGDKDRIVKINDVERYFGAKIKKIKIIRNRGHIINYELPEVLANLIKDFIKN